MCPIKHKFYKKQIRSIVHIINKNIDILMISEAKLDPSFSNGQFHIHGFFESYRLDRNGKGGGILLYIREDIPPKLILTKMTVEGFEKKSGSFAAHVTQKSPLYQNI